MITEAQLVEHFSAMGEEGLHAARNAAADVEYNCYINDGNLKDILQTLIWEGTRTISERSLEECCAAMKSDYDGNALKCSIEDFLKCEW